MLRDTTRLLLALLLPATLLVGQDRGQKPPGETNTKVPILEEQMAEQADSGGMSGDGKNEKGEPAGPPSGLERFMTPVVSFKPRRLAPGESGEMHLVLAMQKSAVLTTVANLQLELPERVGPITFGAWQLDPAKPGKLDTAFQGQPVYDNSAHVVVPVTVGAEATYAELPVSFVVVADVTDGATGAVRGRMQTRARGVLAIGDPLPRPAVLAGAPESGAAGATGGPGDGPSVPDDGNVDTGTSTSAASSAGQPAAGASAVDSEAAVGAESPVSPPLGSGLRPVEGGADWFWYGVFALGAALVLVVVVLARRG